MSAKIEEFRLKIYEITNAIDTLTKYYKIDLNSADTKDEMYDYIDAYLHEWYKVNPYVKFERK